MGWINGTRDHCQPSHFLKDVMTTVIKKEEKLTADQIMIPKIGSSEAQ